METEEPTTLTVKQLRDALSAIPDHTPIYLDAKDELSLLLSVYYAKNCPVKNSNVSLCDYTIRMPW